MDYEIAWSPEATEDLESIATYIARDSEFYAGAVVTEILVTARQLCDFPHLGRVVPEMGNEKIRERFVYSYRLVYPIVDNEIRIIAIVHGKRLLENLPDRL